jgi:hypothetical protein
VPCALTITKRSRSSKYEDTGAAMRVLRCGQAYLYGLIALPFFFFFWQWYHLLRVTRSVPRIRVHDSLELFFNTRTHVYIFIKQYLPMKRDRFHFKNYLHVTKFPFRLSVCPLMRPRTRTHPLVCGCTLPGGTSEPSPREKGPWQPSGFVIIISNSSSHCQ